ncbi:MAG TPA: hypothetical protein VFJ16_12695 [Longimicrobium sp.]|nr:hypothetical protein [Longimicrobium sp.]
MERDTKALLVGGLLLIGAAFGFTKARPDLSQSSSVLARVHAGPRGAVVILFSPADCGTLLESLRLWNRASEQRQVAVHAFVYDAEGRGDAMNKVVRGAALRFPVEPVGRTEAGAFRASLGYRGGSLVALLDPDGRVRYTVPLEALDSPGKRAHVLEMAEGLRQLR